MTAPTEEGTVELPKREPRNVGWIADQFRKQEERRCYVCGGSDPCAATRRAIVRAAASLSPGQQEDPGK